MTRLAAIAVLAWAQLGVAQEPLSPASAVALARTRGPWASAAAGARLVASGRARADAAWPNPIAEWRRENFTGAIDPDIFATVQVPLDLTGRRGALGRAAAVGRERGRADSTAAVRHLEYEVLRAYWRVALARELARIAAEERESRERTAAFDRQRFQEGAVAEVVAMRGALEADRARIAALGAATERSRSEADLARLLGVPNASLAVLVPLDAPSLDALPASDTAWEQVRERRADVRAARLAWEEADRRATAESRGRIGDVNLVGGYKGTAGLQTGLVGLLVPLPVFNRNEGPRERSRGERLLAQASWRDMEYRAQGEVASAVATWTAMQDAGRSGALTLDARAAEVARIAEATYREGASSLLELLEAQRARADTRATAARWAHDAHLAWLDVRRATGLPLLP